MKKAKSPIPSSKMKMPATSDKPVIAKATKGSTNGTVKKATKKPNKY